MNPFSPGSPRVKVNFDASPIDPDAGHSIESAHEIYILLMVLGTTTQIFGGANMTHLNPPPMNGFVADAEAKSKGWGPAVMSSFNEKTLPVLTTLANEFAVFDHWYASIPGLFGVPSFTN